MKTKKMKAALCSVLAIILVLGFSASAFAAQKKVQMNGNSNNGIGAILQPGQTNVPSTFRSFFNVTGVSTAATINWIEVTVGQASNIAGAMLIHQLVLSRNGFDAFQPWTGTSGTKIRFNQFNDESVNGRFDVWFTCSYIGGYYIGPTLIAQAIKSYKTAEMVIDY